MESLNPVGRKSGFLEKTTDEPKGILVSLLKIAKKEEKALLSEVRTALKYSKRAKNLVNPYKTDIFGQSFGIRGHSRQKRFIRLINESLHLTIAAKIHLPAIETVTNEVNVWLSSHKTHALAAELLPTEKKIIDDVRKAKELLEVAVKDLTELDSMQWGSASTSHFFGMYYIPIEHEREHKTGLKFRADWVTPLRRSHDSLESFEKAVEDIFRLQSEINKKYRI
ncbi:MAG: hypothetical protein WC490_08280 [Candidatus Margulisiibacteriota bacterium]